MYLSRAVGYNTFLYNDFLKLLSLKKLGFPTKNTCNFLYNIYDGIFFKGKKLMV